MTSPIGTPKYKYSYIDEQNEEQWYFINKAVQALTLEMIFTVWVLKDTSQRTHVLQTYEEKDMIIVQKMNVVGYID